jgi:3-oxoacyl-[acyl-carrier protein] reductase
MKFENQVVLITGASRGIGAAIAQAFAQEGAYVVVNYLSNHEAAQAVVAQCKAQGGEGWAYAADVCSKAAVEEMVQQVLHELGRIDVLVNNAFAPYRFDPDHRPRFWELGWSSYQTQIDGALLACFLTTQAVLPHMRQRLSGSIINLTSDLTEQPTIAYHDYATAKSALVGFSRHLAAELGPLGIRVNCVAPGLVVPTDSSRPTRQTLQNRLAAQTPLRRLATPQDVAGPVLFLASAWSQFVTGQTLLVDGGLIMR